MPIYEYNGKKYDIPAEKESDLITRMPGAKKVDGAPFYLSPVNQPTPVEQAPEINADVPPTSQTTFDSELAKQTAQKQPESRLSLGAKQNVADITQDMYDNRELSLPVPKNAAQKQEGFWGTVAGDIGEKLGSGIVGGVAGLAKVSTSRNPILKPGMFLAKMIHGEDVTDPDEIISKWFDKAKELSEKGDYHGLIQDPETGETRKKTYSDLWKEGNKMGAIGEALLTATESAPVSATALLPGGLVIVSASAAGQKYNELEQNPDTKDMPKWKMALNAAVSGAIEGVTEKIGAKVDLKMFEPFLKKMTEKTVKQILLKGGVNALIQTVTEGAEEILSQVGGNTVDYATGVTDEFKPLEGVQDAFVYGAAGGAQFGGVTSGAAGYRAAEMHDLNQKIKRSDTDAGKYVENWQGWKEQLNSMFAGERAQALKDIETNPELSEEGKKAAKQYIAASSMRDAKRNELKEQHKLNLEQSAELGKMIYASRQDKQSASLTNLYTEKQKLEAELGEITTLPFEMVEQSEESTPEIIEAKRQYDLVNAQYESVMASLKEEIDAFTAPQVQALQEVAREDGSITELNIGTEENAEMVYLVAGEIATTEDGVIDPSATSPILTVRDSQGRKRMIGRGRVTRVHTDQLEAAKEAIKGQAYDTYLTPLISKLEGKTDYSQGEQVEYINSKGETVAGTVTVKQNNTVTIVSNDGKKTETYSQDELSQRILGETMDDVKIRDVIQVDIDGQAYDAHVNNIKDGEAELYIPSFPLASGQFMNVSANELRQMRIIPNSGVQADSKTIEKTIENEGSPAGEIQQNESETVETAAESQITPEQQAEAEKQEFMQSLPIAEKGSNKGQIDQSQMTPEQNIKFFEYQYGQDKATQAATKMVDNLKKRIKKEQAKLDGDPFNIAQNELVDQLKAQEKAYKEYAFAQMQAQTERNMAADSGQSVTDAKQQRAEGIKQEEAGRTGTAQATIKKRWDAADKIEGIEDVFTLANGEKIPGRYVLTTAEAPSPSHDVDRNFGKTIGFPTNEQGNTVNDRDYESDKTAQTIVQQRANKYDEQAVQNPVVVSRDGIVISGNDRTMAGKLASRNGTDTAYVEYITKYADRWGFTQEMVVAMPAPRIVFVPDVELPYNTATFSKFNAEDKKTQSPLERAIKSSKSVSREIIIPIAEVVDRFNTLAEFYADSNATRKVLQILTRNSIIQTNEIPRLMDGDVFSAEGRSFLETTILGAVLQEQALREVDAMRSVRQSLMRIMPQLARNAALSDYTIIPELNNAIHLLYDSKRSGSKVKLHLMQTNVFEASPAEVYAETEKHLALMLENAKDTEIKAIFESYNKEAINIETGQANVFDGLMTKPELLTLILDKYGRQAESTQQTISSSKSDGQGEGDRSGQSTGSGQQQPKGQRPGVKKTQSPPKHTTTEENIGPKEIDVEGLFGALRTKGEAKLSDHVKPQEDEKPAYGANNKIITQDRYNELREQMRKKLNNLNVGFDPEVFSIGAQMAMFHIESGAHKFADFAKRMVDDLGDAIRPYLKASYEGARAMPGMEELSSRMDPYKDVVAFDVNQRFEEPINNIEQNEQGTRSTEAIEAETETIESASDVIRSESENVGSDQQRAGDVKEQADEQVKKVETLLIEVEQKLANLKLSGKNYSTDGIAADYPINVLAKGPIKKDATAYVKAVAAMTGLEHDTDRKGKTEIVNVNIAPAGGDVTFVLWSKKNPDYGVYVSVPYSPEYRNGYDDYHVERSILWRVTTKQDKWRGMSNQYVNSDVTAQEMAETLLKGLNQELRSRGLEQEINQVENAPETVKNKKINRNNSPKVAKSQNNMLSLFGEEDDVSPINDQNNEQERGSEEADSGMGESEQQEAGGMQRPGVDQGSIGDTRTDEAGGRGLSDLPERSKSGNVKNTRNNRSEKGTDYAPKSPNPRFNANVAAIKLMRKLMAKGVTTPTPKEIETLRKYSGWGGLGTFFNSSGVENTILREILDSEEYQEATNNINSAYYTPAPIIDALWDVAEKLGFKGGNILESSAGIGSIIGLMPESISNQSNIEGVEIDPISGNILKLLYPDANIHVQGFEETNIKNGSVDLAITNVPFITGFSVSDKIDKDLAKKFKDIHDYFIAKNIRKLRQGGIGIFITSNGTLDKSRKLREWITADGKTDVIGAFRLNNETFGGTKATSDIIIVRKRTGSKPADNAIDILDTIIVRTGEYKTDQLIMDKKKGYVYEVKSATLEYNKYFIEHPENMGGEMYIGYEKGETYRPTSTGLFPKRGIKQDDALNEWVNTLSSIEDMDFTPTEAKEAEETAEKEGVLLFNKDGDLSISRRGEAVPLDVNKNKVRGYQKKEALSDYVAIKETLDAVLEHQLRIQDDKGLAPLLKKLNNAYDNFVSKYGNLNKNTAISFLRNDVDFPAIAALEDYSEDVDVNGKRTPVIEKTAVFDGRVIGFKTEPDPKSVKDGVIASIYKFGTIDTQYISDKLERPESDVRREILSERIGFMDPSNGLVEVRYEYLSGNVREKLTLALSNNVEGEYDANIEELEKVIPMDIPAHLIEFSLGSSWINSELYKSFIKEKLGVSAKLSNAGGTWIMSEPNNKYNDKNKQAGVYSEVLQSTVYGDELVKAALNNKTITVSRTVKKETTYDKDASMACMNRIAELKDEFKEWAREKMQADEALAESIMRTYNDKFNAIVPKSIDDMFLPETFEGAASVIRLYPHQKKSVIRGTTEPLLLAHEVGTGKTFSLISTAMEMRRIGTAKKPMIVVQNSTVGQFVSEAKNLYPNAKILSLTERDRTPVGRREFYGKIKYSEWDIIVVPQSTFEGIPDSPEREQTFVREKIEDKIHAIEAMRDSGVEEREIEQAEKELEKLNDELLGVNIKDTEKKSDAKGVAKAVNKAKVKAKDQLDRRKDDVQFFDDMGVDAILVDEAHAYKRLGFATAMTRGVKGIDPAGSQKAASVYIKTRAILEKSGWKNVVFATGTPISNTAAEIWTFMKYLMKKEVMIENDIYYFDDFVRNFGNIAQSLEFNTSGKYKENTRFAAYINKPELIRLWASISDTVLTKEVDYVNDKVPDMEGDKAQDIYLPQSNSLVNIMRAVRKRLKEFEEMSGKEKKANRHIPLNMYGVAKRAAIDSRLVDRNAPDDQLSKTNRAIKETLRSLKDTEEYKGTIAIFCDQQNRRENGIVTFDLFEDIKRKLVEAGVPSSQIMVMESGMTIAKKERTFTDVNAGNIRVIIGNTATLGTGVNIQERLHTLIHMDAPDRPMDYTQRNGRILRQGNLHKQWNKPVRVMRFGVEDSLDVTSYQRLKTKAAFIDSIMDGKSALENNQINRILEEEEEGLFDNPVAVLSGSQYALLKNKAERDLRKITSKKQQHEADQVYISNKLRRNAGIINANRSIIEKRKSELSKTLKYFPDGVAKTTTIAGKKVTNETEIDAALKDLVNKPINEKVEAARMNGYHKSEVHPVKITINGVEFTINTRISRESVYDERAKASRIVMHREVSYGSTTMRIDNTPVSGAYVKGALNEILDNVITGRDSRDSIESLNRANNRMEEENASMNERKGKPFGMEEELTEARKKVEEYTELMKKELAEKEAKYADSETYDVDINEEADEEVSSDDDEELRFRSMDEAGFYSTVEDALESIKQEKGTPEQFKAMLLKNGAKQAELDYMGWDDYFVGNRKLDPYLTLYDVNIKGTITKTDIQDWIDQNRIEVQEVEKGGGGYNDVSYIEIRNNDDNTFHEITESSFKNMLGDYITYIDNDNVYIAIEKTDDGYSIIEGKWRDRTKFGENETQDILNYIRDNYSNDDRFTFTAHTDTKFAQYTLPGGKNYRELLLTMPEKTIHGTLTQTKNGQWEVTTPDGDKYVHELEDDARKQLKNIEINNKESGFDSSHFDEPNILAHVRFNERTVNGERVLFIEEIQSDWAQKGKKEGFRTDKLPDNVKIKEVDGNWQVIVDGRLKGEYKTEQRAKETAMADFGGVPNMPFKKTDQWVNLALRRMMMYAAENGYDRIAWTTGQQQADRYDLSKQVDKLIIAKYSDGYSVKALLPNRAYPNEQTLIKDKMSESELSGAIGKDLAQNVIDRNSPLGQADVYEGIDLKVGGEGMKAFYDQIVPKAAKKLGKPFGADVETINLPISNEEITQNNADDEVEELTDKYESGELELDEFISEMNKIGYNVEVGMDGEVESANRKGAVYKSVQSIPVTDALREIAPDGMPLFRKRDTEAREAYAMREWNRAKRAINELAAKMGVSVEIIETTDGLPKAKAEAKGWYDVKKKEITIVMPNHTSSWDAQATLLHEAVGHYGLRELFGEHFDTFLDNVYNNAADSIKSQIDSIAKQDGFNIRKATEEYLSRLAEDQEILQTNKLSGFFNSVKKFFFEMLAKAGFNPGFRLSVNEMKYILWRSYNNLAAPGRYRSIVDHAKDVAMQDRLKVGNYAKKGSASDVAEEPGAEMTGTINKEGVERSEEQQKSDNLYDNIDNLKSVIPNYSRFLNDVLQGSPAKSDIIASAREKGFTSMPKAIEQYLADVEDPAELSRIKELLGVDMPDNALRYMLWRNANPDDGTVVWKAKEAVKTNELDDNILFRTGEPPSKAKNNEYERRIRSRHNKGFRGLMYGIEEGWVDRMASLRIIQDAITGNKAVPDTANAYMLENQLTSRNTAEIRFFNKHMVDPVIKQIEKLFGNNMEAADVYMNAKHGLERNEYMAREEAKRKYVDNIKAIEGDLQEGNIDQAAYDLKMAEIADKIEALFEKLLAEKDYAGLTALAEERGQGETFDEAGRNIVQEIEDTTNTKEIDALWSSVNKATKWMLEKQYNNGFMTKDNYEKIRDMYAYYVPLRGFDEMTATDLYDYLQNPPSDFNGVVKKAYGRTSKSESPTATIMNMAESGIMQSNRNRMKQAFYRLVATNPSNYASVEDVWLVETADGWQERFPEIPINATGDEVVDIIAEFNNEMQELAAEGQAEQGKNKLDVGVRIFKAQATEHAVRVWIAGEEKVVFINGNPRAAQAINGLTQNDLIKKSNVRHGIEYWSRQMAANFTSRNPAFMITNLMRDVQFALISASVKEGIGYSSNLAKNLLIVGKTIKTNIFNDGNKGNPEFQKYWEEFLYNGGETGYANLHSIDYQRKYVNKKLREFSDQRDFWKLFRAYTEFMESGNRMIEDLSRFATYVTSRQDGRSVERSVSDAKEITLNFNRKGSGGALANFVHTFYLFANPAIQGLRLMGSLAKNHPVRFTAMVSSSMAAGALVPMLNELLINLFGDDDDKEKYRNITPWVRRNNLTIYNPFTEDRFITLMLPHEIRPFYGIGEMAYEAATGGMRRKNLFAEVTKQMTTMLPIDPFSGSDWWIPDFAKPVIQSYVTNRNFMDTPIYRDTPWNKFDPEWTKAYKRTPDALVAAAKWASDVRGGDDVVPGDININPARVYNLLSGYMGGFLTTYTDLTNIGFNLLTGRDVRANDVPVVNKLIRTSDEQTEELRVNSEYFYYLDWIKEYEHKFKGYEKRIADPEYAEKWSKMIPEKEQRMYQFAKSQVSLISEMKDYDEKEASRLKEEFVRGMWEYEDKD